MKDIKVEGWKELDHNEFRWNEFNKGDKIIKIFKNENNGLHIFVNRNDLRNVTWSVGICNNKNNFHQATLLSINDKRKDAYDKMIKYMRSHKNG